MSLMLVLFEQLSGMHHAALFVDYHSNPPNFEHSLEVRFLNQESQIMVAPQGIDRKRFMQGFSNLPSLEVYVSN